MERCPACRARLNDGSSCPRCGCELHWVLAAGEQARRLTIRAVHSLAEGHSAEAARLADAALRLADQPLARAVLSVARRYPQGLPGQASPPPKPSILWPY